MDDPPDASYRALLCESLTIFVETALMPARRLERDALLGQVSRVLRRGAARRGHDDPPGPLPARTRSCYKPDPD